MANIKIKKRTIDAEFKQVGIEANFGESLSALIYTVDILLIELMPDSSDVLVSFKFLVDCLDLLCYKWSRSPYLDNEERKLINRRMREVRLLKLKIADILMKEQEFTLKKDSTYRIVSDHNLALLLTHLNIKHILVAEEQLTNASNPVTNSEVEKLAEEKRVEDSLTLMKSPKPKPRITTNPTHASLLERLKIPYRLVSYEDVEAMR